MTRLEALRQLLALTPVTTAPVAQPQARYQLPAPMTLAQWRDKHGCW